MSLKGKKVFVFAEDFYEDLELWYPYYRLKEEGADVMIIGNGAKESHKSKHGYEAKYDFAAQKTSGKDCDAVIIPGGFSPDMMRRIPDYIRITKEAYSNGAVVAAICHGGWIPASAEIVEGKKVTSFYAIKDDLVHAGAEWVDEEVVVDSRIVTSRKPSDLPAFCKAIISTMQES